VFIIRHLLFILILYFSLLQHSEAQDSTLVYDIALHGAGSTAQLTPFWMHANQHSTVPTSGNFALGKLSINKIYHPNDPRIFQWSAGVEAIGSLGRKGNIFLSDAYIAAKVGAVELMAGQRKAMTGIVDTLLTSGSLSVSGNARPIPRLQISIPTFYPLHFTDGFLSIKASYSDGILNGSYINYGSILRVPNTYFHQKSVYLRLGKEHTRLVGFAGMNHQAVWGGERDIHPIQQISKARVYWHTISGKQYNYLRFGNHFGTIDFALQWKGRKWTYLLYRQNVYETGSVFRVINFSDGLNGLSIKRNKKNNEPYFVFNSFLFEMVNTSSQQNDKPFLALGIFEKGNYYNHYIYRNGWSYYGRNMGTPLVSRLSVKEGDKTSHPAEFTNNNRLIAFNFGATASWLNTNLLFRSTYSRNFGTYVNPLPNSQNQFSLIIQSERELKGTRGLVFTVSAATDIGRLYQNSNSIMVGVKKAGFLN
jgi:hypothetical protein